VHRRLTEASDDEDSRSGWVRRWIGDRDEAAARELMEALHPRVAAILANHAPRSCDRDDLEQEVFLRVFRALPDYRPDRPLEHWVSRIALNVCRDAARSASRRPEARWSDLSDAERAAFDAARAPDGPDGGAAIDAGAARTLLDRLLAALSPTDRQIVALLHVEERPVAEIAALLGLSRIHVRVRAFRARTRLRRALAELDRHPVSNA